MPTKLLGDELSSAYTVERELTGGGMSRVFLATDAHLGRRVVIKILPRELAESLSIERFRREVRVAATLQHPNIVPVLSAGETAGLPFLIMPYVEGESLRARLASGTLTIVETVGILRDVARALAFAHERGIVHRDIKPDNILLSAGAAVVADFGVARAIQSARRDTAGHRSATLTALGTTVGTPAYMAPEQIASEGDLDHRADIYAFGIMAFEMLTGRTPFHSRSHQSLLAAHLTEMPPSLGALRQGVPAALARLVAQCLEKSAEARPQSVREILVALDDPAVISGAFASAHPASHQRVLLRDRRRIVAITSSLGLAVMLALAAVLGAGSGMETARTPPAPSLPTLAVLPLVYLGADPMSFIAEGFTSELMNALGGIPGLRVASRSAVTSLQQRIYDGEDVAGTVTLYLEGAIQREAQRVRVDARLVNAADGLMVWGDSYEGSADSLFVLQDAMSESVAEAMREYLGRTNGD